MTRASGMTRGKVFSGASATVDHRHIERRPSTDARCQWPMGHQLQRRDLQLRGAASATRSGGRSFRGRTDTEVLLQALAAWGTDGLARLDGMFAFAAFDRTPGDLSWLAILSAKSRSTTSSCRADGLAFASELQALEKVPGIDFSVSTDAIAELLMFQYIGAPRTIYRQVRKLPPGHWLIACPGQALQIGRYFDFRPDAKGFDNRPFDELADELEDILVRSLRRRLIADVPLGAFLSGGTDSSTACALIRRRLGVPLKTLYHRLRGRVGKRARNSAIIRSPSGDRASRADRRTPGRRIPVRHWRASRRAKRR